MATTHTPRNSDADPRRLIPLAVWAGFGLIALVLLSRSASGAFTRELSPIVSCLLGLVSLALSLWAWWYDDRRAASPVAGDSDPGRWNNRPTNQNAYNRTLRGFASLIAPLTIGITIAGGASSAIGVLLGLGLFSAAAVLAVSWELDPRPARPASAAHVEPQPPTRELAPPVTWEPPRRTEPDMASPFADPGVSQQVTRRITPDDLDCIEALLRVTFAAGEREAVVHLPIHPPLPGVPEVECEPLEEDDVDFKVTTAQPYGVRIEVRRHTEYDDARTLAIGVALHARKTAEAAA